MPDITFSKVERSFMKLPDVIAQTGGVIKFVQTFCSMMIYLFTNAINETLMNKFFNGTEVIQAKSNDSNKRVDLVPSLVLVQSTHNIM